MMKEGIHTSALSMRPYPLKINLHAARLLTALHKILEAPGRYPRPEIGDVLEDIDAARLGQEAVVGHDEHGGLGVCVLRDPGREETDEGA